MSLQQYAKCLRLGGAQVSDEESLDPIALEKKVDSLYSKQKRRDKETVRVHTTEGSLCEYGISTSLNVSGLAISRFSRERNPEEWNYDLEALLFENYDNYVETIDLIEVKRHNGQRGYFDFNYTDKSRSGVSLLNFINNAHATKYLVVAGLEKLSQDRYLVTPRFIFDRAAFKPESKLMIPSSNSNWPEYYIRYNEAIAKGLCLQIQG